MKIIGKWIFGLGAMFVILMFWATLIGKDTSFNIQDFFNSVMLIGLGIYLFGMDKNNKKDHE